jgi:hypothetical protein
MKNAWKWPGFILVIVLISADSFSQENKQTDNEILVAKRNTQPGLKKNMLPDPVVKPEIMDDVELNYPKVARKFAQIFPSVSNLRWIKEDNTLFAYFFTNNRKAYAVFALNGRMNYAITYLEASDLPAPVAKEIDNAYSPYSIFNVKKVQIGGYTVYRIILENEYEFIHVQISDTDIEEVGRLKKSFSR